MDTYQLPKLETPAPAGPNEVVLVASGDLRDSANKMCWPAQHAMEQQLIAALAEEGYTVRRDFYNLYHVLNHANLFGGSYGAEAAALIARLLAVSAR